MTRKGNRAKGYGEERTLLTCRVFSGYFGQVPTSRRGEEKKDPLSL